MYSYIKNISIANVLFPVELQCVHRGLNNLKVACVKDSL